MSGRKQQLIEELKSNKEYRATYAEQHVNSVLATQISTIRQQRGLTQQSLAALIGKHQPAISRSESVTYARWNITSLRELADAYDCWLNVRFEPWGHLVHDVETMTVESLRVDRIEDDPVFFGSETKGSVSEPVRWMQKEVLPWLSTHGSMEKLVAWLQGENLPPVGDEDPYFLWIARAVDAEPADSRYRSLLVAQLLKLFKEIREEPSRPQGGVLLVSTFQLLARFPSPEGWSELSSIYDREQRPEILEGGAVEAAYWNALTRNQVDATLYPDWLSIIRGKHNWAACDEFDAIEGLKYMQPAPRFKLIAQALNTLCAIKQRDLTKQDLNDCLVDIFENLRIAFEKIPNFSGALRDEGDDIGWYEALFRAWAEVFKTTADSAKAMLDGSRTLISEESSLTSALLQVA